MRGFAAVLVLLAILFSALLLTNNPAFAVTMETVINPDSNSARLSYEELHTLTINYPAGSRIAKLFGSGTNRLVVTAATNDTQKDNREAMQSLLASINDEFKKHSSVTTAKYADIGSPPK